MLFMAHYRHHRQKEIDDEDSFDFDIEDNMLSKTILFQEKKLQHKEYCHAMVFRWI
mgnify:CR=1 FL=1